LTIQKLFIKKNARRFQYTRERGELDTLPDFDEYASDDEDEQNLNDNDVIGDDKDEDIFDDEDQSESEKEENFQKLDKLSKRRSIN